MKVLFNAIIETFIEVDRGDDAFSAAFLQLENKLLRYLSVQPGFEVTKVVVRGASYGNRPEQTETDQ